ncbi:MAG: nitroreductase family protein, partial [Rhodospirillaceae bacterium]|nr:nitroreductase family protein [Rhodospirillaceae bacterium]
MELNDVMRTTFSARDYTGEELPDGLIYDLIENARFAPSGGNRQGNRVIVVRDQATRDALSKLAEPAAKRYVAQSKAGESPWNAVIPTKVTAEEI